MPPTVRINYNSNLDREYEEILRSIDQRFHSYETTFPEYPTSEEEWGEIETNTMYAQHAGDDLYIGGTHIERLLG